MRFGARLYLLALTLLVLNCGEPDPPSGPMPTPALSFAQSSVVFPETIIDHASSNQSITLTNTGNASITIAFDLSEDADFLINSEACHDLAPAASCDVLVSFQPHALGAQRVDLIATGDGVSVATNLVGVALPEPGLSAASPVDYGDVEVGTPKTLEVTVVNGSNVNARAYAVALTGTDAAHFAISNDHCSGVVAAANASCTVEVTFTPTDTSPRNAQVVVTSANLGNVTVELTGNGYVPAQLSVSPASGMFGSVFALGQSPAHSFTVTNSGTVPSPPVYVSIGGPDAALFSMTDACSGSTLVGGGSCMFSIVYRPQAAGQYEATATVSAQSLPSVVVPLTGTGEPPQIDINPPSWNFGQVFVGESAAPKTFTIKNTGSTNTGPLVVGFTLSTTAYAVTNDTCTGVDLAPAGTCSLEITATAVRHLFSITSLIVGGTRGDKAVSPLQIEGIMPATLVATPASIPFGNVQMTETPTQFVTIDNVGDLATGTMTVAITGPDRADVSFVFETCSGLSLQRFYSCSFKVSFAPSHVGTETAAIEITSPGANLSIPVTADSLPAPLFTVSPSSLVLNPVAVGQSYSRMFAVQGTGAATGALTVSLVGANAADYAVTDDQCSGQTIASGQSCTVTVTLTPTATGSRQATLVVAGQPGGYRNVSLTGVAFTQATLTMSKTSVMFAGTGIGQTSTNGYLTVTNTGQLTTGTLSAQLVGTNPSEFGIIVDTCSGVTLAANAQCFVQTQFAPTQEATSTANLVVSASPGGTVTAALSGTGLPPPMISSTYTSYDFGTIETFGEPEVNLRIDNVGGSTTDHLHASISGPQASLFTADDYSCYAVAAGGYCYVNVKYRPVDVGQASATLVVDSPLAGTVTIALRATAAPGVKIVVSPDTYNFGLVMQGGTSAAKTFVATNIGQRDITMFQVFVPGDRFKIVATTCGTTLAPNASCQADVVFQPTSVVYPSDPSRLVFAEGTTLKGEAQLIGQSN